MSGIWVVLEERDGRVSRASWEALAAGQKLAQITGKTLNAVGDRRGNRIAGAGGRGQAREQGGAHRACAAGAVHAGWIHARPATVRREGEARRTLVFPHTYQVRDFAPALAARMNEVLISDVVGISEGPTFTRQLLQGRLAGSYRHAGSGPCFVSVQAGAFRTDEVGSGSAEVTTFMPTIDAAQIRTKPGDPFRGSAQTVDLGSAQRIVSVGRGIKDADNLPLVQELAEALGAEIAASRPICDNGWLPMERQVGSSGQTVSPKLYLAVGISGAIQHLVGMKGSQCIVAINKDPEAPIFEVADYGIVGDLFEVVPALTEAVKAAK